MAPTEMAPRYPATLIQPRDYDEDDDDDGDDDFDYGNDGNDDILSSSRECNLRKYNHCSFSCIWWL